MKITIQALFLLGMYSTETSYAFAPKSSSSFTRTTISSIPSSLQVSSTDNNNNNNNNNHDKILSFLPSTKDMKNIVTTTIMSTLLWTASPLLSSDNVLLPNHSNNNFVANAKEMASGSGSRVNKDPESLLRYGLPIPKDKEVRR